MLINIPIPATCIIFFEGIGDILDYNLIPRKTILSWYGKIFGEDFVEVLLSFDSHDIFQIKNNFSKDLII